MRVLNVVTDRDRRGAQVFASDLDAGLRQLGVDSEVVALAAGQNDDQLQIKTLGPTRRSWRTLRELRRRSADADVVIAHGSATLLATAVALVGTGVPFVYRQISDPHFWAATLPRRVRVAAYLRRAARIVALSETAASVVADHYRLPPDQITVIPNAVSHNAFTIPTEQQIIEAHTRFGLAHDRPVLLYMGALAPEKGVDIAIRTADRLESIQLLIVGEGPDRTRLEGIAASCSSRVIFAGAIDDPISALHAADILLLPSRGGDSMPAVLIEAGLTGLPCVTTPVGSIADVVIDNETGRVVPVGDQAQFTEAVRALLDDHTRRREFGAAAARRCAERFTIATTAPAWRDLAAAIMPTAAVT